MRRKLFTLAAGAAAVLFAAVCLLWFVACLHGRIRWPGKPPSASTNCDVYIYARPLCFGKNRDTRVVSPHCVVKSSDPIWIMPFPLAVLALSTLPLRWLALYRPDVWRSLTPRLLRRRVPGLCHVCGYDLRATPERCPECGAVPGKAAVA